MSVEEQPPRVGAYLPAEDARRPPGPDERVEPEQHTEPGQHTEPERYPEPEQRTEPDRRADPAALPSLPSHGSRDELVSLRNMALRLSAAYPSVDPVTVETTIRAAYDVFHRARVRTYVPILVERRSRRALDATPGTHPARPGPAKD